MPKFEITASEVNFYRSTIEADSAEAVAKMFEEDDVYTEADLVEFDGEAMVLLTCEEIK